MKITITFDSLEEFKKHIIGVPEAAPAQKAPEGPQSDEEPKPQEEDAGRPDEAPAPEVSEDFRVEVRKTLAKLNKKVGKNMASDLIKEFGVEKLTEVALSDLPALMDKAMEALNAE